MKTTLLQNISCALLLKVDDPNCQYSILLLKNGTKQVLRNPAVQTGAFDNAVSITPCKFDIVRYTYYPSNNEATSTTFCANGFAYYLIPIIEQRIFSSHKSKQDSYTRFEKTVDQITAVWWRKKTKMYKP